MTDLKTHVEQEMERASTPSYRLDDVARRRDRKRRNQRITAGFVGVAVFVALVVLVTVGSIDRARTPAIPGQTSTSIATESPTTTESPTPTESSVTRPLIGPNGNPYSVGFDRLPPDAAPSEPSHGERV